MISNAVALPSGPRGPSAQELWEAAQFVYFPSPRHRIKTHGWVPKITWGVFPLIHSGYPLPHDLECCGAYLAARADRRRREPREARINAFISLRLGTASKRMGGLL